MAGLTKAVLDALDGFVTVSEQVMSSIEVPDYRQQVHVDMLINKCPLQCESIYQDIHTSKSD